MRPPDTVSRYAIAGHGLWADSRVWVALLVALLSIALVRADARSPQPQITFEDYITFAIGAGAFLIALLEWYSARRQESLERFYDRLDLSNSRLEKIIEFEYEDKDPYTSKVEGGLSVFDMWVFTELDNLEYVLDKYQNGFLASVHADRALRTFIARCRNDPAFNARALELSQNSSYQTMTTEMVERIHKAHLQPAE